MKSEDKSDLDLLKIFGNQILEKKKTDFYDKSEEKSKKKKLWIKIEKCNKRGNGRWERKE